MQHPINHTQRPKHVLSMINKYNLNELNLVDRPIEGRKEGFSSTLQQHNRQHQQRFFSTENRTFFGHPLPESHSETLLKQASRMRMAGTVTRPIDLQSTKIISNLQGENLNVQADP